MNGDRESRLGKPPRHRFADPPGGAGYQSDIFPALHEPTLQYTVRFVMNDRLKVFVIHGRGATPRHPDVSEEGGDLDTISSNVFYGVWAHAIGAPHEFTFVQYHDGLLKTLWEFENADIYIPDLPLDTVPHLENDVRDLARRGSHVAHFLDHHPWSNWQVEMLNRLKSEGLLGRFALAGAQKGKHLPKEAQACGAELVYDAVIRDQDFETEGLKELRRITRLQDLGIEDNPVSGRLSKLISYGYPKYAMVTALMMLKEPEDLPRLMQGMGWDLLVAEGDERMSKILPRLKRSLCEIRFEFTDGHPGGEFTILCCLVPKIYPGEPLPNVSTAIRYLKDYRSMEYFFYCYGSRALTTRKVTTEPGGLNLGDLVEKICTPKDGGHPEAATGRPQGSPYFPKDRLTYITPRNFIWYCRYLSQKLRYFAGVQIVSVRPVQV